MPISLPQVPCPRHGRHPWDTFPPSTLVSQAQVLDWLLTARRVYHAWNLATGLPQHRLGSPAFDPARAEQVAQVLWAQYCTPATGRWAEVAAHLGLSATRTSDLAQQGLTALRHAAVLGTGPTLADLEPRTRLAVALYGCEAALASLDPAVPPREGP